MGLPETRQEESTGSPQNYRDDHVGCGHIGIIHKSREPLIFLCRGQAVSFAFLKLPSEVEFTRVEMQLLPFPFILPSSTSENIKLLEASQYKHPESSSMALVAMGCPCNLTAPLCYSGLLLLQAGLPAPSIQCRSRGRGRRRMGFLHLALAASSTSRQKFEWQ